VSGRKTGDRSDQKIAIILGISPVTAMRFLLSHNYSITPDIAPPLTVEAFCQVFAVALKAAQVKALNHPHWRCEIVIDDMIDHAADPQTIGESLAAALAAYRKTQLNGVVSHQILALGGLKTTPATSASPEALQPGEWGVDMVETIDATAFLDALGWEKLIADKPATDIFQVKE
jgi:hypothetical protein